MAQARKSLLIVAAIVVICGAQQLAQADPLVLSLQNNSLAGVAGGTVTFVASATNTGTTNTNTVTIFGVVPFSDLPAGWNFSTAPFFANNWSGQQVASGATFGPLGLFSIIIPPGTPDGSYMGNVNLVYGGTLPSGFSNVVDWTVRVGPDTAPVPEPATMLLLGSGLVGIAAKVRKRRKSV